jgi:hypothetical protein
MPVGFDWEFEEEPDSSRESDRARGLRAKLRRWLPGGLALVLLLVVTGFAVGAWVKGRLDAVKKVEAELQGVVALELKTISEGDVELFRGLQDSNDPRWEAQQIARYFGTSRDFVPAPGLATADRHPEISNVDVLGRDGRAELTFWLNSSTSNRVDPLSFRVTWFYRQDDDGVWHHVSPSQDYRGLTHSWHGTRLVIRATEAEEELLDAVARDLAGVVLESCWYLDCPENVVYTLSFDRELAPLVREDEWLLPALYLTGVPEGDEALAMWLHALKSWVIEALVRSRVGGRDLTDRVVYHQLLNRLRERIGLAVGLDSVSPSPDVGLLADALREGRHNPLQSLWQARYRPESPEETRLLEHQVALLIEWVETKVGDDGVLNMLSRLDSARFEAAVFEMSSRTPTIDLEAEWFSYLFERTAITEVPLLTPLRAVPRIEPPVTLPSPVEAPGDQIAFICGGRIWAGNADGSRILPLTSTGDRFRNLLWSPDGRWLLTTWLPTPHGRGTESGAQYLLAIDRRGGQLLSGDSGSATSSIGWSPDGRDVIYNVWQGREGGGPGVRATNIETGRTRSLPGRPLWSPDGTHAVFVTSAENEPMGTVWLADADWQSVRQIISQAWIGSGAVWAPDSSQLALSVNRFDADTAAIVIYDLETNGLALLVTADALTEAFWDATDDLVTDGTEPVILPDRPLRDLWSAGWSADGSQLYVTAQATTGVLGNADATVLAAVSLDGSQLRVLARGSGAPMTGATSSPANPDQMLFVWPAHVRQVGSPSTYLFDLTAGPVYTNTQSWEGKWSPDGAWAAFAGENAVTVVDDQGRVRATLGDGTSCTEVAWNPKADLSALSGYITITLVSAMEGWQFDNVRVDHDPFSRTVQVWGEVANATGDDQRIAAFVPVLRDRNHNVVNAEHWDFFQGRRELVSAVDLADGSSLPFGLAFRLPTNVHLAGDAEVVIFVAADPGQPTRDDLDIPFNDYDMSMLPGGFRVTGTFENLGPDLSEYVTVVVTVFGLDGQLMGWGWRREIDPAYLTIGTHAFDIPVTFAQAIIDRDLEVGYYKIQVFGR